jgi:uncharacterized integral membrane protein (TIGR00698 family)
MKFYNPHFRTGIGLTVLLAIFGLVLGSLPGLVRLGPLSVALLLGLAWRAFMHVPEHHHEGISFSAKRLLRWGIILLGVRLDFALIAQSGWKIVILDLIVIGFGVFFITWLGKRAGLAGQLPLLLAVGSSICGASAVAAAAPVIRARDNEIALAIPMCGILGTIAALGMTFAQNYLHLSPNTYGILAGSTLHEVAQVMAASAAVPGALQSGTIVKLLRVVLLVPVIFFLGQMLKSKDAQAAPVQKPWFVGGFLLVGIVNTALIYGLPQFHAVWAQTDQQMLTVANFLMTMAMAGLGLQVDISTLRTQGVAAIKVAVAGWIALLTVATGTMYLLGL